MFYVFIICTDDRERMREKIRKSLLDRILPWVLRASRFKQASSTRRRPLFFEQAQITMARL